MKKARKAILWILSVLSGVGIVLSLLTIRMTHKVENTISIIGGADGPTSVFVAGRAVGFMPLYIATAILVLALLIIFCLPSELTFWNRQEVFITMEIEQYIKAKEILLNKGIAFDVRIKRHTGRDAHILGRLGESENNNTTYSLYTDKKTAEEARYHLNQELH